ncbi:hypothetical protein SAMN05216464_13117, partial [Mucilaginibacter pineti]
YGTAKEKGVGLGMQLVKDFAAQNGVGVAAKSSPGNGTTFILSFVKLN